MPREGVGLRGEWVVPFSSGAGLRASQREKVVAPRPMGLRARIIPVFVPTWSLPHRARRFGSAFAFPNGFTTTKPAPRGLCEKSPNLAAELPLPLGAAALALGVPSSQRVPLGVHPRARLVRALLVPKVALARAIGRGSRS